MSILNTVHKFLHVSYNPKKEKQIKTKEITTDKVKMNTVWCVR